MCITLFEHIFMSAWKDIDLEQISISPLFKILKIIGIILSALAFT